MLAPRSTRVAASVLDKALLFAPTGLLIWEDAPDWTHTAGSMMLVAVVVLQIYWLTTLGQSIGKKIFGIKIVSEKTGRNAGFVANVILREILAGAMNATMLCFVVDVALFFMRSDRRALHDLLAQTKVVMAATEPE